MCGFSVMVSNHNFRISSERLDLIQGTLDKRGPDEINIAFGNFNKKDNIFIGGYKKKTFSNIKDLNFIASHSRLAITGIKDESSIQPIMSPSHRYLVLFNG